MGKAVFTPMRLISGVFAGMVASRIFDLIWVRLAGREAPVPDQREMSWPAVLLALMVEGAIIRLTRVAFDRGARRAFARATGAWPGEERPAGG
jgi:Protein of unknown function (DUF4235)